MASSCECSGPTSHLPGFRFHPTDEELLFHFLYSRIVDGPQVDSLIKEQAEAHADCEPYELPGANAERAVCCAAKDMI